LSAAAWSVLRVAAIGGQRIDDELLRRVCPLATEELDAALGELLDCHILEPDTEGRGYVFRHALTAQAVYDNVLPGERVRLHTAFAQAIEEAPDLAVAGAALAAVERAGHWSRARHGSEALGAWVEAATAAKAVYAHPEALAAYDKALELWPIAEGAEGLAGMDEVELLRSAAEAAYRAGPIARAITLAQNALTLVDERAEPLRAAALTERLGSYCWFAGREQDSLTYYQQAVELAPESPPSAELARALAGHARILMLHWIDTAAAQRAEEAIDVARRVGAVAAEAHALNTLAVEKGWMGEEAAALDAMAESARLSERSGDDENIARLWVNHTDLLLSLGDLEAAASVGRQGYRVLRDRGLARSHGAFAGGYGSLPLIDLGFWSEARVLLDDCIGLALSGWWLAWPLLSRAWLHWLTGDIDAAERDIDEIPRLATDLDSGQFLAAQARTVAALSITAEHWETAVRTVTDVVRRLPSEDGRPVVHWETMTAAWPGLWAAAELMRERGTSGSTWLAPHLAQFDGLLASAARRPLDKQTVRHRAQLALCQAERARIDGSASSASWRPAVEALDALGAIPQRAYARLRLAEALLAEGGQRRQAADALNEAIVLFAGARQSPIRALAEQLGRRARLRFGQPLDDQAMPSSEDRFGLTEREIEVLRLLIDGRTNREIGEALFISPKTVSVHVTSAMRKLGVRRRAEAARIFRKSLSDPQRTH
jgi:DNA-binding CsgD family transcriptional regulator